MTIKEFLDRLASDEDLLQAYLDNPTGVVSQFDLTAKQIRIITSHDVLKIRHAIELEEGDITDILIHIVM